MPGQIRCTQFFTSGAYGWSDTVWSTAEDPVAAMHAFITLAGLRFALLGTEVESPYLRTSDDLILRDAAVVNTAFDTAFGGVDKLNPFRGDFPKLPRTRALESAADQPYSAILLRMQSGTLSHRMSYLRGAPDRLIVNPPGPASDPRWDTAFNNYRAELTSGRWYYLRLDRNPGSNPVKPVQNVVGADPNTILTVPAHGFVSGDSVFANKFVGTNLPRGNYTVLKITDDTLKLKEYTPAIFTYLRGGFLQKNTKNLGVITSVIIRGETHRDTGLPFDRPRGRRKRR